MLLMANGSLGCKANESGGHDFRLWGAIVMKLRKMKMATPAVHANAWFCLLMAVIMLLAIPSPRLDPAWLMIVVLIIAWICYLGGD